MHITGFIVRIYHDARSPKRKKICVTEFPFICLLIKYRNMKIILILCFIYVLFCFLWRCGPAGAMASSFLRFLDHTQRRTIVGRTPLCEWSARLRDLYLTTHNNHNRQTSMPPVGFEPTISASERPQTYALNRAATGTGFYICNYHLYKTCSF